MSPSLFISYRTEDAVFAGRIYDSLKQHFGAERIFFDQRSIRAGAKWDEEIDRSLATCGAFLLVITPRWLKSFGERGDEGGQDYHLREISLALDRSIPVIPLVIDEAEPPSDRSLPEVLRGRLPLIQWERVRNDRTFDDSMTRLRDQIEWIFDQLEPSGGPDGATLPPPPPRPAPPRAFDSVAPPPAPPASGYAYPQPAWTPPAPPVPPPAVRTDSREWRLQHSVWPWGVLCCGFATWVVFLYIGLRAKQRAWVIAGIAYLAVFAVLVTAMQVTDDGLPEATSTGERTVAYAYGAYWIVSLIHLAVVNTPWLRWRAADELGARSSATGAPAPGGPPSPF